MGSRRLIVKGYAESGALEDLAPTVTDAQEMGNFCVWEFDPGDGLTRMKTSRYRSFTCWASRTAFGNLYRTDRTIWADSSVAIDQDLGLLEKKFDAVGPIDVREISRDQLIDQVHDLITTRVVRSLRHNARPVRVFLSGGIDSMLVFSYVKAATDRFHVTFMNHVEWDDFWCQNQDHIKKNFWGYSQIHHWCQPTLLTSGTPGDEFMLRSPVTANLWLQGHGTSIPEQLASPTWGDCLHADYFKQTKHQRLFDQQRETPADFYQDRERFIWKICNMLANDHQHWHLGHTLTFTPLRDLEIAKLFLRLDLGSGLAQIMSSDISRALIERNDPDLLHYLSDTKNSGETLSNLTALMSRYRAVSGQ